PGVRRPGGAHAPVPALRRRPVGAGPRHQEREDRDHGAPARRRRLRGRRTRPGDQHDRAAPRRGRPPPRGGGDESPAPGRSVRRLRQQDARDPPPPRRVRGVSRRRAGSPRGGGGRERLPRAVRGDPALDARGPSPPGTRGEGQRVGASGGVENSRCVARSQAPASPGPGRPCLAAPGLACRPARPRARRRGSCGCGCGGGGAGCTGRDQEGGGPEKEDRA
ncbi:unnamed protein product, partial [Scytosiphon promiscuus]